MKFFFSAIMGLNKRKKANASLSSSEAELTDNEQDSHPLPQVFPRFFIIEPEDVNKYNIIISLCHPKHFTEYKWRTKKH